MEICQVGAALIQTDTRTDMRKLTDAFSDYANASKNW